MKARDVRIGVAGLGQRSIIADHAHRPGAGSVVVACSDPDPRAREGATRRFGEDVVLVSETSDMLELDLDAVMILTPDHTHEEIAIQCLNAGTPIFVEKPLAITTEACDHILRIAMQTETGIFVGHNMRHMPVVLAMRNLILQGAIGDVKAIWCRHFVGHGGDYYFKDWHADRRNTTGLLLQKGSHDLDILHWLGGAFTKRLNALGGLVVYGGINDRHSQYTEPPSNRFDPENNWPPLAQKGLNDVIDVEDVSMVQMILRNGVLASYQQCHFTPDYWRNYTVIGSEGRLENFGDTDGAVVKVWNRRSDYRQDADAVVNVQSGPGGHGGADISLLDEFISFIRSGTRASTSPVAAREAVATAHAATESIRNQGQPVEIQPLTCEVETYFRLL